MNIDFDPKKDAINLDKHSLSLIEAEHLDWDTLISWPDTRRDYGEKRMCGLGYIGTRLHSVVFVDRGDIRRIISLRKANPREYKRYART